MTTPPQAYELAERLADDSIETVPEPDGSYKIRVAEALQADVTDALS